MCLRDHLIQISNLDRYFHAKIIFCLNLMSRFSTMTGSTLRLPILRLLLVSVFGGAFVGFAIGQTATSDIAGTVRDATTGVLPGVKLTVTNQATGQERHILTGNDGNYIVTSLPAGEYTV